MKKKVGKCGKFISPLRNGEREVREGETVRGEMEILCVSLLGKALNDIKKITSTMSRLLWSKNAQMLSLKVQRRERKKGKGNLGSILKLRKSLDARPHKLLWPMSSCTRLQLEKFKREWEKEKKKEKRREKKRKITKYLYNFPLVSASFALII